MILKKRGPVISMIGLVSIAISLSIAFSVVPNDVSEINNFSNSLLEDMFDEISNEIQIMPGDSAYFSHSMSSSDVLMWGVRIIDYQSGDELSINISNIYGDNYGVFLQNESVLFEMLKITPSDTINLEVKNIGTRNVNVIAMFSEDPENSDPFSNADSSTMNVVLVLALSGFLLLLGIIISVIGTIVLLVYLKNNQNNKGNY